MLLRERLHGALAHGSRRIPRPARAAAGRSGTAARPGRTDPHRPLQRRLRPAPAARPPRRGVRRHGRCLPPQPHGRPRPCDRPHPRRTCTSATPTLQGVAGEILVTDNVAPSELAQLQAQGVVAIVTAAGSALSHSAILARSLHLPLVVGAAKALQKINDGDVLIVDGASGSWCIEPERRRPARHRARLRELAARTQAARPPAARTHAHPRRRRHRAAAPTPNRARTWPRRMRWAPPAWACTAPNSCSCSATNCPTRKSSSAPIAMSCWA